MVHMHDNMRTPTVYHHSPETGDHNHISPSCEGLTRKSDTSPETNDLDRPYPSPETGDLHRPISKTPGLASERDAKLVISL